MWHIYIYTHTLVHPSIHLFPLESTYLTAHTHSDLPTYLPTYLRLYSHYGPWTLLQVFFFFSFLGRGETVHLVRQLPTGLLC
jgi:hypothetical protein